MKYRLGAEPERHGQADCLTLSRYILSTYGIGAPQAERSWYRRLRKKDYSIFREQLELWGTQTTDIRVGTVALCQAGDGVGLATFIDDYPGWLSFIGDGGGLESGRGPQYRKSLLPWEHQFCETLESQKKSILTTTN